MHWFRLLLVLGWTSHTCCLIEWSTDCLEFQKGIPLYPYVFIDRLLSRFTSLGQPKLVQRSVLGELGSAAFVGYSRYSRIAIIVVGAGASSTDLESVSMRVFCLALSLIL
ncbi:hypothetical protein KQX54_000160 [Cotesia glomerata]|uniref:Secreted protein n=1 Tax=Cotesia glomerata TaxID=32391 RepID=A0AAV7IH41_COTGL|nr:hypothetical protein KQX54_000160 [Cotesia glomerata]